MGQNLKRMAKACCNYYLTVCLCRLFFMFLRHKACTSLGDKVI